MIEKIIIPKKITKENFSPFGDIISTKNVKPIDINAGYAKRYDNLANIDISNDQGNAIVSIFSASKRTFPMKIDMMEKHPLGSQAFIESFIVPPGTGINYKLGIWHFPLISTDNMNFLVVDRKGPGDNLIIENLEKEKIILEY